MIYIPSTPGEHYEVGIPNAVGIDPLEMLGRPFAIEIRNDVGRWTLRGGAVLVTGVTPAWLKVDGTVIDPAIPEGEYTYRAYVSPDVTISEGLLIVGDYAAAREQYEKTIEYEQYD